MEGFEIEKHITDEERSQAKAQTLNLIKNRYLQYKADYIAAKANNNSVQMEQMYRLMREADIAYQAVMEEM